MRLLKLIESLDSRLNEHAEDVRLHQREVASRQGEIPTYTYFPIDSVFSVLVMTSDGASTEVAAIGNEGMVGIEAIMGGTMYAETVCQVPGRAVRVPSPIMATIWEENLEVRSKLQKYMLALLGQFTQSAACNRLHSVDQRAARWLLAMADRNDATALNLTHEFLAAMLGANRTTVTLTLRTLERAGLIRRNRHEIVIENEDGLRETACECYETIRRYHEQALVE